MLQSPNALQAASPRPWLVLRRAFPLAARIVTSDNVTAYLILAIFAVIDGALMRNYTYTGRALIENAYPLTTWLIIVAFYFTLAAAVRVRDARYRMPLVTAFGVTVSYLLVLMATFAGLFCLIVPGIWIGTRLALAPFCYVLDPGESPYSGLDAIASSWRLTAGHFWSTLYLLLLQMVFLALPLIGIELLALAFFTRSHASAYFSAPLLVFCNVYVWQVTAVSTLDWVLELRAHDRIPKPTSV